MKESNKIHRLLLVIITCFIQLICFANYIYIPNENNTATAVVNDNSLQPWLWIISGVVFVLMIIALFQDDGYRSAKRRMLLVRYKGLKIVE